MRALAILALAILLASCGSMSNVVNAGPNTYLVSAGGGMYQQNPSGIREKVYTSANSHCAKLGKTMEPVKVDERPYALGRNTANISLAFTCE